MPMKRISSSTFFLKRVFPVIWFGFLALFLLVSIFAVPTGKTTPPPFFFIPVVMAVFGYVLMKKIVFDLADEVSDAGDYLLVRFGEIQERVELANIINVSYVPLMNPPRVTLTLRQPCCFGKDVSFTPVVSWVPFSKSPVVTELIERIDVLRRR